MYIRMMRIIEINRERLVHHHSRSGARFDKTPPNSRPRSTDHHYLQSLLHIQYTELYKRRHLSMTMFYSPHISRLWDWGSFIPPSFFLFFFLKLFWIWRIYFLQFLELLIFSSWYNYSNHTSDYIKDASLDASINFLLWPTKNGCSDICTLNYWGWNLLF